MILGSGTESDWTGIEFDYCCCTASIALHEARIRNIMVNMQSRTVSTDYDTSDRLYFRTADVRRCNELVDVEKPERNE